MNEAIRLGDIIELVSNVRQMDSMLDGSSDLDRVRTCLASLLEDRKALMKFMMALRRTRRAADSLSNASLSFVSGFAPPEEESPEEEFPERPIPRRARRAAADLKERTRIMGNEEDTGDDA